MVSEDKPDPFSCDFWFRYQNGNVPQLTAFESRRWRDRATRGPLPVRLPPRPDGWNELELRVTPQRTQAFLNAQPIAVFTRTHLEEYARDLIGPGPALGPHPDFPPRGGIGLFVHRGGGSFRDVRIEPLSDEADGEGD